MGETVKLETGYAPKAPEPPPVDPALEEMKGLAKTALTYVGYIDRWVNDILKVLRYVRGSRSKAREPAKSALRLADSADRWVDDVVRVLRYVAAIPRDEL